MVENIKIRNNVVISETFKNQLKKRSAWDEKVLTWAWLGGLCGVNLPIRELYFTEYRWMDGTVVCSKQMVGKRKSSGGSKRKLL